MGRTAAVIWHASFCVAAGVLYFFFVLPRTPELLGDTSHTLGTALRIVAGAFIGLAALPVVFTLLRTRSPEFGTPVLALNLRTASIALHALSGLLIIGAAISEIWLSLDDAGQWLFGIYGAAAAIALLGAFAFYLAFVAEKQPPPPKPLKVSNRVNRRTRTSAATDAADADVPETDESDGAVVTDEVAADETAPDDGVDADANGVKGKDAPDLQTDSESELVTDSESVPESDDAESTAGTLKNRRTAGKGSILGRRKKSRSDVAVDD